MNVFQSLYTPDYLVRTPKGEHGVVRSFDQTTNMVTVQLVATGMYESSLAASGASRASIEDQLRALKAIRDYRLFDLRAGNDDSEMKFNSEVTSRFPKRLP